MASRDDIEAMSHAMEILKLQLVEKDNEIEDMKQDYSNLEQKFKETQAELQEKQRSNSVEIHNRDHIPPPPPIDQRRHSVQLVIDTKKVSTKDCFDPDSPHRPRSHSVDQAFWKRQWKEAIELRKSAASGTTSPVPRTRKKTSIIHSPNRHCRMNKDEKLPTRARYIGLNHRQSNLLTELYNVFD